MIERFIYKAVVNRLGGGKTIIIYGPRQSGKTTLVQQIIRDHNGLYINADFLNERARLESRDEQLYRRELGSAQLVVIDEAQQIPQIGMIAKTIHDTFPDKQLILTGSSSFELGQKIVEPMTGRTVVFYLMPLGLHELYTTNDRREYVQARDSLYRYGFYPQVVTDDSEEKRVSIESIAYAYLFKDVLTLDGIKKSDKIVTLAKLLAFQIGQQVSYNELAQQLGLSVATVEKYITILEQAFVVFRLPSYSKNLRKELSKSQKVYFWDIGVRHALVESFHSLDRRIDKGAVRENIVIAELMKQAYHTKSHGSWYFWRTYDKQEIDIIRTIDEQLFAYEIKLSPQKLRLPSSFSKGYPDAQVAMIHSENILEMIATIA